MSYELMSREDYQISYAIGPADLTDWYNGGVKLAVAELNACDWFHSGSVVHTKPKTVMLNPGTSAGHIPRRLQTGLFRGSFNPTFYLQTGIFTYAVMGACTTTEATPNTHDITKATTESPVRLAFHLEKEGTTHQRRKDIMGMVPRALDIVCSENNTIALQTIQWDFSHTVAADDCAQPTDLAQATHTPYNWFHYKDGNGASAFTYNSNAVDADIMEFTMHIGWNNAYFGAYNGSGYPTQGLVIPPFDSYVTLGLKIKDNNTAVIDTIADTAHGSYAGDLDFICDFYESANRYLKFTWDKMYIDPQYEEVYQAEGNWYDGIKITLKFLDENSSLVVQEKNALNNDYYENPA